MFTRNDLVDVILRHLAAVEPVPPDKERPRHPPMLPKGRIFLSEYELKKRLTPQAQQLKIPRGAIVSPLAADWLVLKGVRIIEE